MSKLSGWIAQRMATLDLTHKDVATRLHDRLADGLSFTTVGPKLSKLLGDDAEGEGVRFFFDGAAREQALAEVLETTPEALRALRDVRALVLDPALDPAVIAYLQEAAQRADARHECVVVPVGEGMSGWQLAEARKVALRVAAKENPRALVVIAGTADAAFFEGAGCETTDVDKRPPGWVLRKTPELVPLPPPPPPRLVDEDGTPRIPDEETTRTARERYWPDSAVYRVVRECEERGETPTFRITESPFVEWLSQRCGATYRTPQLAWPGDQPVSTGSSHGQPLAPEACWWVHRGRVIALGPVAEKLRPLLAPHHDVHDPSALLDSWRTLHDRWNPWRIYGVDSPAAALLQRIGAELGVYCAPPSDPWLPPEPQGFGVRPVDREAIRSARRRFAELALRGACESDSTLPFLLEAVAAAPLRLLDEGPRDVVHVVANLGAGNVVRVRVVGYPEDVACDRFVRRNARHSTEEVVFDAGEVVVSVVASYEKRLEGTALPARARRRREDEQAAYDAYDDD